MTARLLTPREVAALFAVRTATVDRWARTGRLAYIKTPGGAQRRYPEGDVLALLALATTERQVPDVPVSLLHG